MLSALRVVRGSTVATAAGLCSASILARPAAAAVVAPLIAVPSADLGGRRWATTWFVSKRRKQYLLGFSDGFSSASGGLPVAWKLGCEGEPTAQQGSPQRGAEEERSAVVADKSALGAARASSNEAGEEAVERCDSLGALPNRD
mmetsp:Transcript_4579/g.17275  ORF Transcript_4579/g.17275 Transcript_4579/m.17275 type:complete len:144 (-) Transcript_4579:328-759(-)